MNPLKFYVHGVHGSGKGFWDINPFLKKGPIEEVLVFG
jgi:hypothetical protein